MTHSDNRAIITVKDGGLVVLPRGPLPDGLRQPISQAILRIEDGRALILSRHTRREYQFGTAEVYPDKVIIVIPIK